MGMEAISVTRVQRVRRVCPPVNTIGAVWMSLDEITIDLKSNQRQ
jgi:hypothetical protein